MPSYIFTRQHLFERRNFSFYAFSSPYIKVHVYSIELDYIRGLNSKVLNTRTITYTYIDTEARCCGGNCLISMYIDNVGVHIRTWVFLTCIRIRFLTQEISGFANPFNGSLVFNVSVSRITKRTIGRERHGDERYARLAGISRKSDG